MTVQGAYDVGFTLDGGPNDQVILGIRRNRASGFTRLQRYNFHNAKQRCDEGFDLQSA